MSQDARYPVPASRHRVQATIERSRFICTLTRASNGDEAQAFIRDLDTEFPDATHNCWAYVFGPPGTTSQIGMSDDGEPHGTAGRPMLTVLLHSGVGDVAAVVTRYYGGVKLGTGGLVKAYGGAVQQALATLPLSERIELVELTVRFAFPVIDRVRQLLPTYEAELLCEEYGTVVEYRLCLPQSQSAGLRAALLDATRGQAEVLGTS